MFLKFTDFVVGKRLKRKQVSIEVIPELITENYNNGPDSPDQYYTKQFHGDFQIGDIVKALEYNNIIAQIKCFERLQNYILIEFIGDVNIPDITGSKTTTYGYSNPYNSIWVNKENLELVKPFEQFEDWED